MIYEHKKLSGTFMLGKTKQRKMPRAERTQRYLTIGEWENQKNQVHRHMEREVGQYWKKKQRFGLWVETIRVSSLPVTLEEISQYTVVDRHISQPPTGHYPLKGIFFNFILFI